MADVTKLPPPAGSLAELCSRGPAAIEAERAKAASSGHGSFLPSVHSESAGVVGDDNPRTGGPPRRVSATPPAPEFHRGSVVRHIPSGRKVTILYASSGEVDWYEVVDGKTGRRWQAHIKNLKPL